MGQEHRNAVLPDQISRCWLGGYHSRGTGACFDTVEAAVAFRDEETKQLARLRDRILAALKSEGLAVQRIVNQGALEEELWTEDEWRDEYADALERELAAMVNEGLLATGDLWGMEAYSLASKDGSHA